MDRRDLLLSRLDAIGASLAQRDGALALLGLGSVGVETGRLDQFSDLDFFAIVEPGKKQRFLQDLGWLSEAAPLTYTFRNSVDGFKILFEDGVYGELAVFEPEELSSVPFAEGRVIWRRDGVDESIRIPVRGREARGARDIEWCVGETLTSLYVGMCRYRRGERLSAQRLVQHHAVDRLVELAGMTLEPGGGSADPYSSERRVEQRYPLLGDELPRFVQGYERTPESARAILEFLESRFDISAAMAAEVRRLVVAAIAQRDRS